MFFNGIGIYPMLKLALTEDVWAFISAVINYCTLNEKKRKIKHMESRLTTGLMN